MREWFAVLARSINTASAFLLALVSGSSYRRTAAQNAAVKQQAWHRWWQSSRGTFNALVEQEGLAAQDGGATGEPPSPPATPGWRQPSPSPVTAPTPRGSSSSSSGGRGWHFWRRQGSRGSGRLGTSLLEPPSPQSRGAGRGSLLFDLPSGFGVSQVGWGERVGCGLSCGRLWCCCRFVGRFVGRGLGLLLITPPVYFVPSPCPHPCHRQMVSGRGLLEDLRLGSEVAVGRAFGAARRAVRALLLLDAGGAGGAGRSSADSPADLLARRMRRREATPPLDYVAEGVEALAAPAGSAAGSAAAAAGPDAAAPGTPAAEALAARRRARRPPLRSLLRSGRHWEEDLSVWTASDVILREGYPLEQHSVTTQGARACGGGPAAWRPLSQAAPRRLLPALQTPPRAVTPLRLSPLPPRPCPCARRRVRAAGAPHPAPRRARRRLLPARRAGHQPGLGGWPRAWGERAGRRCAALHAVPAPCASPPCYSHTLSSRLHRRSTLPPTAPGVQRRGGVGRLCRLRRRLRRVAGQLALQRAAPAHGCAGASCCLLPDRRARSEQHAPRAAPYARLAPSHAPACPLLTPRCPQTRGARAPATGPTPSTSWAAWTSGRVSPPRSRLPRSLEWAVQQGLRQGAALYVRPGARMAAAAGWAARSAGWLARLAACAARLHDGCPSAPTPNTAAITHIHNTKMAELAAPGRHAPAAPAEAPTQRALRRAGSDSALHALRWVDVRSSSSSRGGLELDAQAAQGAAGGGEQQQQDQQQQQQGQQQQAAAPLRRTQSAPRLLEQGGDRGQAVPLRMQPSGGAAAGGSAPFKRSGGGSGGIKKRKGEEEGSGSGGSTMTTSGGGGGGGGGPQDVLPYRLQAVGHSLGAASLMMYAVVCRMRGQPHRLRRLVLMSPAGFHPVVPVVSAGGADAGGRRCAVGPWLFSASAWVRAASLRADRASTAPHMPPFSRGRACAPAARSSRAWSGCWTARRGCAGAAWAYACPPRCCATSPSSSRRRAWAGACCAKGSRVRRNQTAEAAGHLGVPPRPQPPRASTP